MIKLNSDELTLLTRVLEDRPNLSRKGNPRLRPLSLYSSELKNIKQIVAAIDLAAKGEALAPNAVTAKRYANTLSNLGIWEGDDRGTEIGPVGAKLLAMGGPEFWQSHTRKGDRLLFERQLNRLLDGQDGLVNLPWREAFFNVQDVLDHLSEADVRVALGEADLKEIEVIQYINSVGTEPWRYGRLLPGDRRAVQDLVLQLRAQHDPAQIAGGDAALGAAIAYGSAANTFQRDVRFRVAGFVEAFLDLRAELGDRFPRLTPDGVVSLALNSSAQSGTLAKPIAGGATAKRVQLPLPLQVIISGCPGSGKSALVDRSGAGALVFRTQFHADTTTASFVGGYRPVPVYEPSAGIHELSGVSFSPGRPLIDYRFVPGQALLAAAAALREPDRNVVLLIEELNRANAAAVFGEVFLLLDRRDDGWSRYGVLLGAEAMNWLSTQGALGEEGALRLPPNLHLWATMNSGDQGVFPIDSAFRRRWAYRYLGYAEPCAYSASERIMRFGGINVDWDLLRAALNRRLKALGVNEDRLLGPYFLTRAQLRDPAEVLNKLLLYLWDDVLRFRQQELFAAESFAGVAAAWREGEGLPLINGVLDLEAAKAPQVIAGDGDYDEYLGDETPNAATGAAAPSATASANIISPALGAGSVLPG